MVAPADRRSTDFFKARRVSLGSALMKPGKWFGVHFSFGKTKGAAVEMGFLPAAKTLLTSSRADYSGQVISDSLIGFFDVDSRLRALGDKLPSFE